MRAIGVRELKANLSRVLRDVQAGEPYLVTDRGRVVAELRRPDVAHIELTPAQRTLARWAEEGRLRVAERPDRPYLITPVKAPPGTAKLVLDAEREDR
jgi:antitoxin (DNA-binding transcriptional repressor) of toxin-antitoxin stability system